MLSRSCKSKYMQTSHKTFFYFSAGIQMPEEDIEEAVDSGTLFEYTKGVNFYYHTLYLKLFFAWNYA